MKRILNNWQEIEQCESFAREKTGDPEAGFNAGVFFLSGDRQLLIPILYRKKKRSGEFTQKYFQMNVAARFCPFTGKPLFEEIDLTKV